MGLVFWENVQDRTEVNPVPNNGTAATPSAQVPNSFNSSLDLLRTAPSVTITDTQPRGARQAGPRRVSGLVEVLHPLTTTGVRVGSAGLL